MRYPLYEESDGICMTYVFKSDPPCMEVYVEIPTDRGVDSAKYFYPEDRLCEVDMSSDNMQLLLKCLCKCSSMIASIWNDHMNG